MYLSRSVTCPCSSVFDLQTFHHRTALKALPAMIHLFSPTGRLKGGPRISAEVAERPRYFTSASRFANDPVASTGTETTGKSRSISRRLSVSKKAPVFLSNTHRIQATPNKLMPSMRGCSLGFKSAPSGKTPSVQTCSLKRGVFRRNKYSATRLRRRACDYTFR